MFARVVEFVCVFRTMTTKGKQSLARTFDVWCVVNSIVVHRKRIRCERNRIINKISSFAWCWWRCVVSNIHSVDLVDCQLMKQRVDYWHLCNRHVLPFDWLDFCGWCHGIRYTATLFGFCHGLFCASAALISSNSYALLIRIYSTANSYIQKTAKTYNIRFLVFAAEANNRHIHMPSTTTSTKSTTSIAKGSSCIRQTKNTSAHSNATVYGRGPSGSEAWRGKVSQYRIECFECKHSAFTQNMQWRR